uniref:Uncharacterized protein n=1 Tax=Anopheles maculatus TaxID=74869 RepID=A0A182S5H2_9DIPT
MASLLTAASATAADSGGKQQTQSPQSLSPRNAASPNANVGQTPAATGNTTTVALNNPTAVKLGVMDVPKALQDGEKFIKWDEVSDPDIRVCAISIIVFLFSLDFSVSLEILVGCSLNSAPG